MKMKFKTYSEAEVDVDIERIAKAVMFEFLGDFVHSIIEDDPERYGVPILDDKVFKDTNACYRMIGDEVCDYISEKIGL